MSGAKNTGKGEGGRARSARSAADEIDALFQLPLGEFTAARNALATRTKKAGDADSAERIKGIPKPSVAAWAANQLYWQHRIVFDRLLDSGERFRKAQASQLSGKTADFRAPLEDRRAALSELSGRAATLLTHAGNTPTPDTMRRVTTTLEALSTYAGLPDTPQPGRLTDDVQPPGFETLAALIPRVDTGERTAGPTRVIPFQQKAPPRKASKRTAGADDERARAAERKAQIARAKAAMQEAERALRDARKDAQRAEENLKKAAARAKEADAAKKKAEQQLEQVAADAEAARKNARAVAVQAEEAAQAVEDAERSLDKVTRELEEISNSEP